MPNILPSWPPRDWRAFAALVFSVAGAVVLTAFVWWGTAQLLPSQGCGTAQLPPSHGWSAASEVNRATTIRWTLWIAVGSIGLVLLGMGMAINRRTLKAQWGDKSAEFEGGENTIEVGLPPVGKSIGAE